MPADPHFSIQRATTTAVLLAALGASAGATTHPDPAVPAAEAVVILETYRMVEELGEDIWPGFSAIPFPIVLVTEEIEFLIGWEGHLPRGFASFEDSRLGTVASRDRVFSPELSAAFPAFGPPSVVVIGTMQTTGRTPAEWALTLLHEHFHQLQYGGEGYQADVERLDLAGDDTSGMWMLEYPFPYADEAIGALFDELAGLLARSLTGDLAAGEASAALAELRRNLDPADARYLDFQLWQEGVARFVEARAAEVLASDFELGSEFLALGAFGGWKEAAIAQFERTVEGLTTASLPDQGRVAFYPVGAALAVLLERHAPTWKDRYEDPRFALAAIAGVREGAGVEITYLANEGFLLAAGEHKVLIDALFAGLDGYPKVPAEVGSKLARAAAPFDGIDLVLATHFHGDHFGAAAVARHLAASGATFVSTPDAVARLAAATDDPVRAVARYPAEGQRSALDLDDDLGVEVLNLHHGRSRPEIQNLGFLIELGGLKILHVGDTEVSVDDLRPYDLASEGIDVALVPGWIVAEPRWRPVVAEIAPRHVVVMHLAEPSAPASWFGSAGNREGRIALIREHFPEAWIPTEPMARRRYAP